MLAYLMTRSPVTSITQEDYWRMFELIRGDVEAAIKSNFTYLTIHRLAAENADISTNTIASLNSGC